MKVSLCVVNYNYYLNTRAAWQSVWEAICQMAYENRDNISQIITEPDDMDIEGVQNNNRNEKEHSHYYSKKLPGNDELITLDYMWKRYSNKYKDLQELYVVPEFTRLHVPRSLFESLGVIQWFRHSFPNCQVTFWEE